MTLHPTTAVALALIAVGAALLAWTIRRERLRVRRLARWWTAERRSTARNVRLVSACGLLALAAHEFSRPDDAERARTDPPTVIAVDVSRSMLTADLRPDRLRASLDRLRQFVAGQPGRTFGVVAFAAEAMVACPLTPDTKAVVSALGTLEQRPVIGGTSIASALRRARDMLGAGGREGNVILVTDGEDFGGPVDQVLDELRTANVRVFTLGAGTELGGPIPAEAAATGQQALSRLNVQLLTRLSRETGGSFAPLAGSEADLSTFLEAPAVTGAGVEPGIGVAAIAIGVLLLAAEILREFRSRTTPRW